MTVNTLSFSLITLFIIKDGSYLSFLSEYSDIVTFGTDHFGLEITFFVIRNPAVLLSIERLVLLFSEFLGIMSQILIVRIIWREAARHGVTRL